MRLKLTNKLLKMTVKPVLSVFPSSLLTHFRKTLDIVTPMLPAPIGTEIKPMLFKGFDGESITCLNRQSENVILYLHGGAYVFGSHHTHRQITSRLAQYTGARVVAINYRKAPECPYPAAVNDAVQAYENLLEQGYSPKNITIAGDSAGGNLSLCTLIALRDSGIELPSSAALISPWTDMTCSGLSRITHRKIDPLIPAHRIKDVAHMYAGGISLSDPRLSPLFADLSGLPPILIHVGEKEALLSDSLRLADKLSAHGVKHEIKVWDNAPHVFHLMAQFVPQADDALRHISMFANSKWSEKLAKPKAKVITYDFVSGRLANAH